MPPAPRPTPHKAARPQRQPIRRTLVSGGTRANGKSRRAQSLCASHRPPPFRPPPSTPPLAEEVRSEAPCERIATHAAAWREGAGVLRQSRRRRGAAAGEEQPLPPSTGPLGKAGVGKPAPGAAGCRGGRRGQLGGWRRRGPLCPSGGANSVVLVSPGPAGPL